MRCNCCDRPLSNLESTRKFASGTYVDMCTKCLGTISESVSVIEPDTSEDDDEESP